MTVETSRNFNSGSGLIFNFKILYCYIFYCRHKVTNWKLLPRWKNFNWKLVVYFCIRIKKNPKFQTLLSSTVCPEIRGRIFSNWGLFFSHQVVNGTPSTRCKPFVWKIDNCAPSWNQNSRGEVTIKTDFVRFSNSCFSVITSLTSSKNSLNWDSPTQDKRFLCIVIHCAPCLRIRKIRIFETSY